MSDFLTRRGCTWHFVRRVPTEFSALDRRGIVRHSTRIKIPEDRVGRRAARVASTVNEQLELFWKQLAGGTTSIGCARYDEARRHARALGYEYIPNSELITVAQDKRLERLDVSFR